tara:strand:+ start:204 stop:680 length:477 start_codon:yes stop_codon:yes gene_type:complete
MNKIYLIHAEGTDTYKIGLTKNVNTRIRSLQTSNPNTLSILKCIDGDIQLERRIHSYYKKNHLNGEWFTFDNTMIKRVVLDMDDVSVYGKVCEENSLGIKNIALSFRTTQDNLDHLKLLQNRYDLPISNTIHRMIEYFIVIGDEDNTFNMLMNVKENK